MAKLGTCTPRPALGEPTGILGVLRELSPEEITGFQTASLVVGKFRRKRQLFELVRSNRSAYLGLMVELADQFAEDTAVSFEKANEMVVGINGRLLNFLSSVRTFLDHAETDLNRQYGEDSEEFKEFKQATSREYDGNFSYRFLNQVRNFTQHCGLPLGELKLNADLDTESGSARPVVVEGYFLRDHLLTNFKKWKHVKNELEKMPERFPVKPHIEEMLVCLERLEHLLVRLQSKGVEEQLAVLEGFSREVSHMPGAPCVYNDIQPANGGVTTNLQRIHPDAIAFVRTSIAEASATLGR